MNIWALHAVVKNARLWICSGVELDQVLATKDWLLAQPNVQVTIITRLFFEERTKNETKRVDSQAARARTH